MSNSRGNPKQGKTYIPGLGNFFKISPDEIYIDELGIKVTEEVLKNIQNIIDKLVEKKIGEITALDRYLTKEEEKEIRKTVMEEILKLDNALDDAIEEHNEFLTSSDVDVMIANSLQNYYTKQEADIAHENFVTEFTKDEVLGYWYAMFPK